MITAQTLNELQSASPDEIRQRVRETLEQTPSFLALPLADRLKTSNDLVRTFAYLCDPAAGRPELARVAAAIDAPVRRGQAPAATGFAAPPPDATEQLKGRLARETRAGRQGIRRRRGARRRRRDGAVNQKDVDFVGFVSGADPGRVREQSSESSNRADGGVRQSARGGREERERVRQRGHRPGQGARLPRQQIPGRPQGGHERRDEQAGAQRRRRGVQDAGLQVAARPHRRPRRRGRGSGEADRRGRAAEDGAAAAAAALHDGDDGHQPDRGHRGGNQGHGDLRREVEGHGRAPGPGGDGRSAEQEPSPLRLSVEQRFGHLGHGVELERQRQLGFRERVSRRRMRTRRTPAIPSSRPRRSSPATCP